MRRWTPGPPRAMREPAGYAAITCCVCSHAPGQWETAPLSQSRRACFPFSGRLPVSPGSVRSSPLLPAILCTLLHAVFLKAFHTLNSCPGLLGNAYTVH